MRRRPFFASALAALAAIALTLALGGSAAARPDPASAEGIVEGRVLAPCCYVQTLDVHESELATALRLEVHDRLAAGETADAIERDFVARYGERVRAVPAGRDTRQDIVYFSSAFALASAIGLGLLLRRWRRSADLAPPRPTSPRDAYDDRVDAELRDLEG
jgi:cytochrome c-type biogenesis protein CcmH